MQFMLDTQLMRAILISILLGIFAAGLVWMLWDLAHKRRADNTPPPEDDDK